MTLEETIIFHKVVMYCYDNKEFRQNWERLRKKQIREKGSMKLFISDVKDIVWDRLPRKEI